MGVSSSLLVILPYNLSVNFMFYRFFHQKIYSRFQLPKIWGRVFCTFSSFFRSLRTLLLFSCMWIFVYCYKAHISWIAEVLTSTHQLEAPYWCILICICDSSLEVDVCDIDNNFLHINDDEALHLISSSPL